MLELQVWQFVSGHLSWYAIAEYVYGTVVDPAAIDPGPYMPDRGQWQRVWTSSGGLYHSRSHRFPCRELYGSTNVDMLKLSHCLARFANSLPFAADDSGLCAHQQQAKHDKVPHNYLHEKRPPPTYNLPLLGPLNVYMQHTYVVFTKKHTRPIVSSRYMDSSV